jgi:hypothetical protein
VSLELVGEEAERVMASGRLEHEKGCAESGPISGLESLP